MSSPDQAFEGLLDRYFEAVLARRPIAAAYAGLSWGEGRLGHASRENEAAEEGLRVRTLAALDRIPPRSLSNEQHLDRLALRARLRRESEDHARGLHRLNPSALDTVLNILLHELQRGEDEPARGAANLRSLLREIPRHLEEAAALSDRPDPVWLRVMHLTYEGSDSLLEAVATFLEGQGVCRSTSSRDRPSTSRWLRNF